MDSGKEWIETNLINNYLDTHVQRNLTACTCTAMSKSEMGSSQPVVSSQIAWVFRMQGSYGKASGLYSMTLSRFTSNMKNDKYDDTQRLYIINDCAIFNSRAGFLKQALYYFEEVLKGFKKYYEYSHPFSVSARNNINHANSQLDNNTTMRCGINHSSPEGCSNTCYIKSRPWCINFDDYCSIHRRSSRQRVQSDIDKIIVDLYLRLNEIRRRMDPAASIEQNFLNDILESYAKNAVAAHYWQYKEDQPTTLLMIARIFIRERYYMKAQKLYDHLRYRCENDQDNFIHVVILREASFVETPISRKNLTADFFLYKAYDLLCKQLVDDHKGTYKLFEQLVYIQQYIYIILSASMIYMTEITLAWWRR